MRLLQPHCSLATLSRGAAAPKQTCVTPARSSTHTIYRVLALFIPTLPALATDFNIVASGETKKTEESYHSDRDGWSTRPPPTADVCGFFCVRKEEESIREAAGSANAQLHRGCGTVVSPRCMYETGVLKIPHPDRNGCT